MADRDDMDAFVDAHMADRDDMDVILYIGSIYVPGTLTQDSCRVRIRLYCFSLVSSRNLCRRDHLHEIYLRTTVLMGIPIVFKGYATPCDSR